MASENTRTPTSVARENTYYFRSGRPLPQYLNQEYTEKLKVLENGNVVPKDDNDTAVREWLAPLDKICLYQFLIHDLAQTFIRKRLQRFENFNVECACPGEQVDTATAVPYTAWKVRLSGLWYMPGGQPFVTSISRSFSHISMEDAMLKMALYYQDELEFHDIFLGSGTREFEEFLQKQTRPYFAIPERGAIVLDSSLVDPRLLTQPGDQAPHFLPKI